VVHDSGALAAEGKTISLGAAAKWCRDRGITHEEHMSITTAHYIDGGLSNLNATQRAAGSTSVSCRYLHRKHAAKHFEEGLGRNFSLR
jgi:hypothetical protein